MAGKDLCAPPFEAWATVSISDTDSDSQDNFDFEFPTLLDEVHRREIDLIRLMKPEEVPKLEPSPSFLGRSLEQECLSVLEALKLYLPGMEEETSLYEEFRAMKVSEPSSPLR